MRKSRLPIIVVVLFLPVFSAFPAFSAQSDTSYGDYRVKEKERERSGGEGLPGTRCAREDRDTGSCFSGCFSSFFDLLGEVMKESSSDRDSFSSVSSAAGKRECYEFAEQDFRYAVGIGLGMLAYSDISAGFQLNVFNQLYFLPLQPFTLRANLGCDLSVNSIRADFERDVFVDTGRIGTQTITTSAYSNISIPLLAELVLRPSGEHGSFHFIAGGGAGIIYERVEGVKSVSYAVQRNDTACSAFHLRPALSLGFGWLNSPGNTFGSIELYYRTCFARLDRKEPLPGANTSNSHSVTLEFSIIF